MVGVIDGFLGYLAAVCAAGFILGRMTRMHSTVSAFAKACIVVALASPLALPMKDPEGAMGLFFALLTYAVFGPPFLVCALWGSKLTIPLRRPARAPDALAGRPEA